MTGEEIAPGAGIEGERVAHALPGAEAERATPSSTGADGAEVVTRDEKLVLDVLVSSGTARTQAQLCARSGLSREQVAAALEGLRTKGLVTRFNTLVESYATRFPGVDV